MIKQVSGTIHYVHYMVDVRHSCNSFESWSKLIIQLQLAEVQNAQLPAQSQRVKASDVHGTHKWNKAVLVLLCRSVRKERATTCCCYIAVFAAKGVAVNSPSAALDHRSEPSS